jgi:hypothetical protein
MNLPGNDDDIEGRTNKWGTIRYAIKRWSTTFRLLLVLLILSVPCCLAIWAASR